MAIDLEAIKRKLAELNGEKKPSQSSIPMWKPTPQAEAYKIRALPWPNSSDGIPIPERWFYYLNGMPAMLAPYQFKKPDPINQFMKSLYNSGNPDDKLLAKKLHAKMRAYLPIIVRGQEEKGVQIWSFGVTIYKKLLGYFSDEEVGDFLDPLSGYDLKVSITKQASKDFNDTEVEASRKQSRLMNDDADIKKLLDSIPSLDDAFRLKSEDEMKAALDKWLSAPQPTPSTSDGTSKGASAPADELDKLIEESKTQESKPAKSAKKKGASEDTDKQKKDLDDAFAELLDEEND